MLDALAPDDPLRRYVEEIQLAGERASGMTKQLLAFTRKQVLLSQVLDLNELVVNVNGLLARLIGEDIELVAELAPAVHAIEADSGQLEQVVVNLAVNARDAMPGGGTLTISTANCEIQAAAAARREIEPGQYVTLSVADTGEGMDAETLQQIFEPFFTTKEEGKGTGLGLATAFGIVKQSGGDIQVESEPGRRHDVHDLAPARAGGGRAGGAGGRSRADAGRLGDHPARRGRGARAQPRARGAEGPRLPRARGGRARPRARARPQPCRRHPPAADRCRHARHERRQARAAPRRGPRRT